MDEHSGLDATLVRYADPAVGAADANAALRESWKDILGDADRRAEAAALLGVAPGQLPERCPFVVTADEAGTGAVEYTVIAHVALAFASEVAWDLAKDVVKDQVKAAFLLLWRRLVYPRAEKGLPNDALGRETALHDDVQ